MASSCATARAQAEQVCGETRASFLITLHQALSDLGAFILSGLLAALAAVGEIPALLCGWWPVALFLTLDTATIIVAVHVFRVCQRHRREEIVIDGGLVIVRRYAFRAAVRETRLNCFGLTVIRHDDDDFGCRRLFLSMRGRQLEVAGDLSAFERGNFADALTHALQPLAVRLKVEASPTWALLTKGPYAP